MTNIQQRSTRSSQLFVFIFCLVFRFFNAHLTRTYDNPDEYWQSQEVAHNLVFGNGYLTWEWREKIRSFAHPIIIAALYKLIQWMGLDNTQLLVVVPRYFQAVLTAMADVATFTLAKKVIGNQIAPFILFTSLCSWFNFFMAARTLSNSIEMVFTILALNYWPLTGHCSLRNYRIALILASIACVMRPTNALIWLFLGIHLLIISPYRVKLAMNAAGVVSIVLLLNTLLDTRLFTGVWSFKVFTPWLFFKTNVINSISLFYGVHTWHWYLTQGIPVILTTFLPFVGFGLYRMDKAIYDRIKILLGLTIWMIIVYSLLPHKEFRFIFPIVPILFIVAAYGLQQSRWRKRWAVLLVLTQIPMAIYFSVWHQRGVMDAMLWIRNEPSVQSVGVLMPCHSTPWYSIVHKNIPMWFLTCEPPLANTMDEADEFYASPFEFLKVNHLRPASHLILFDNLVPQIVNYLKEYEECQRFFNSHFHDDSRRRGDVVIFCHHSSIPKK
ncbi:Alg9-like mannosyltransferase family-domain-containing protein [Cokeromyces recurvatus]|uniref:Alg9-like mannosyltransferase family-domain-containing protein n=1 Tax=Cokeromyces recurvatus TaxID=90255 RepID=UPI002220C2DF|nr:Alg9-like mannosyltransferase family-domain-containing protein [Cokeromyces recurvatus]KAI7903719.1 Alg9-like mannosyltransferase family-domain-containing protein [Cokeromyces recurvatus]